MTSPATAEERWRLTIDNAPVGIALVDLEGRFERVNTALADMLGHSTEELQALTFQEITHPDDLAGDLELLQQLTDGTISDYRLRKRYFHRDGHVIWIDLTVGLVRTDDGHPLHYVAHIIDRSDEVATQARMRQLHAEVQAKAEALARSNADLEAFAVMASHDLQAPLVTISGYLELLAQEYAEELAGPGADWLDRVQHAADRMSELVTSLLGFSRSGHVARREEVSLPELVSRVEDDLAGLLAETGGRVEVDPDSPTVLGDGPQLRQVVQNLVQNALKYRHPERPPVVRVAAAATGSDWLVTVADNARGVPADERDTVFTMFRRGAGDEGGGTGHGVGLSSCRRIVERHGGRIWVEDAADGPDGPGSRFCFTLPVAGPEAAAPGAPAAPEAFAAGPAPA